jgi:hypothetical protein
MGPIAALGCVLSLTSCAKRAKPPASFTIADIPSQCEGGERTRALVTANAAGILSIDPDGAGPGFRFGMISLSTPPFSGSTQATYWCSGAEQVFRGKVSITGFTFDSDPDYNLTFKLIKNIGFTYLCGRGIVTTLEKTTRIGDEDTVDTWLNSLTSPDGLRREGAAQALGALAKTSSDQGRVVPRLIESLGDSAFEVRRNAAESLGRIGDPRAVGPLTSHADPSVEKDEWVRQVAGQALKTIRK